MIELWMRGKRKAVRLAKAHWQAQHLIDKRHDKRRGRDNCRLTGRGGPGEIKGGRVSLGTTAQPVHNFMVVNYIHHHRIIQLAAEDKEALRVTGRSLTAV